MISRATAIAIGDAYLSEFTFGGGRNSSSKVYRDLLYDFLFENDYEPWFSNMAKQLFQPREVKEWVMRLHTGETQAAATVSWTWEKRRQLGQRYLKSLGEDIIRELTTQTDQYYVERNKKIVATLVAKFELDGYIYRDGQLIQNESDALNVEEETSIILHLAKQMGLARIEIVESSLKLSESHYIDGRWSDSISNSRKAFECVLSDAASLYASQKSLPLSDSQKERPVEIRDFLQERGLLEMKEKEAIAKIYGLLSHTGSHPYMAEKDQARLLRQLSLTLSQFVLLRIEGALKQP